MNNQPSISIVMSVYNASACLCDALDSVLQQTFSDFELLVVDDGSTDNSIEVVKSYIDHRIRLITNTHNFISSLNKGINAATGKYIARMDADDIVFPCRLQTQFDFMESHPDIDICGSYAAMFGEMQGIMQRPVEHKDIISTMLLSNPVIHPSVMIRVSMLRQSGCLYSYSYPCAEDYKLWTKLALKGLKFANISEPLLRYRISPQQVTRTSPEDMYASSVKIRLEYSESVMDQMIKKDERYSDLLNSLTALFNNELISPHVLSQMLYPLYREFLHFELFMDSRIQ